MAQADGALSAAGHLFLGWFDENPQGQDPDKEKRQHRNNTGTRHEHTISRRQTAGN